MVKYQKYAEYIHTDNNWIKEIPYGWKIVPLKYMCKGFVKDGPHETPVFVDEGIPFLSVDGIQNNKLVFESCRYISKEDDARFSLKCKPQKGNVLLGKAASVGKVAFVDTEIDFNVWSPLAVINSSDEKLGKYIFYCLQSYELQLQCDVFSNSNTQKNLGMTTIDNLSFPYPSFNEAQTISHFLDHETAKIDTLIAKQEKLIELLKEKRQAVISHAVAKGLDPNIAMKDSGVEWLGDVPEHWVVTKFGFHTLKIGSGKTPKGGAEIYQDEGVLFIRSQNVYNDGLRVDGSESTYISEAIHDDMSTSKVYSGDILLNITGGSIGRSCLVPDEFPEANVNQHVCIIRVSKYLQEFLALVIQSDLIQAQIQSIQTGGNREGLNFEQISKFYFALPTLEEQEQIVKYIKDKVFEFSKLEIKAYSAIQLMKERRTALISAAVTGKIDVRNWKHSNKNNNQDDMELSA
ncbi:restriction endonuclease subunit S [Acinetobacter baumannii]|uniref:restriction endonuclease subunit S n=1 Tax=Acinetobacter baumannii TaxID=470 RepID=UPI0021C935D6|nr:restriction endonuclease subunit S [Acinetobacter baumannii]HCC8381326.1 restriction endonuclease subunit S [Acinetobacter baumannii]